MFNTAQANIKNTIYATASPSQKSGIIVVRISGPDTKNVIQSLRCSTLLPRHATLTKIHHPITHDLIDTCIAIYYESPKSFTGEDVLELNIHGGMAVLDLTLDALSNIDNLRVAERGEFSMRAFLHNKMDLTELEGLEELINSNTTAQHKQAIKQLSGELKDIYENWRSSLIKIISNIEAYIDFPDEDIPEHLTKHIGAHIDLLIEKIESFLGNAQRGEKLLSGLYIAILGPTNAGKSSLINKMARRDVAIVSKIEGTTRDVIEINLDINGYPVTIADTAGLRESEDEIENEGIKRSLERAQTADLKIILLDATKQNYNHTISNLIDENCIIAINKTDLTDQSIPETISGHPVLLISVKDNIGIDQLMSKITSFTTNFFAFSDNEPLITKQRQRENLTKALQCLKNFSLEHDLVLATEELRMAANYLGSITGRIDVESVLGEIFSSFCIGK